MYTFQFWQLTLMTGFVVQGHIVWFLRVLMSAAVHPQITWIWNSTVTEKHVQHYITKTWHNRTQLSKGLRFYFIQLFRILLRFLQYFWQIASAISLQDSNTAVSFIAVWCQNNKAVLLAKLKRGEGWYRQSSSTNRWGDQPSIYI